MEYSKFKGVSLKCWILRKFLLSVICAVLYFRWDRWLCCDLYLAGGDQVILNRHGSGGFLLASILQKCVQLRAAEESPGVRSERSWVLR